MKENFLLAAFNQMNGNGISFSPLTNNQLNNMHSFLNNKPIQNNALNSAGNGLQQQGNAVNIKSGLVPFGAQTAAVLNSYNVNNKPAMNSNILLNIGNHFNMPNSLMTNSNGSIMNNTGNMNGFQHGGNSLSSSPRSSTSSSSSSSAGSVVNFGYSKQQNNARLNGTESHQNSNGYSTTNNTHQKQNSHVILNQNQQHHHSVQNQRQQQKLTKQLSCSSTRQSANNGRSNVQLNNNASANSNGSGNSSNNGPSSSSGGSSRYKTELCRPFDEYGFCKYSDKCQYAHGQAELRSLQRHPKYKTELCRTFHTTGFCPYGPRCHFIHNNETSDDDAKEALLDALTVGSNSSKSDVQPSSVLNSPTSSTTSSLLNASNSPIADELALQLNSPALMSPNSETSCSIGSPTDVSAFF